MSLSLLLFAALVGDAPSQPGQGLSTAEYERSEAYAKCVVGRASRTVARGFAENWAPENFSYGMSRTTEQRCMRNIPSLAINTPDLRYVLAKEWLKSSGKLLESNDFSSVPPLSHQLFHMPILRLVRPGDQPHPEDANAPSFDDRDRQFSTIGECIVRRDTKLVTGFLRAGGRVGPTAAVMPLLQHCVPANTQVQLSPSELTGLVALSYARLVLAMEGHTGSKEAAK